MLFVKRGTRRVTHAYSTHAMERLSEWAGGQWIIARFCLRCLQFLAGRKQRGHYSLDYDDYLLFLIFPRRPSIPSEITGPISAHNAPLPAPAALPAAGRDMALGRCVLLLLLLYIAPASCCCCCAAATAAATAASTAATAERLR